ncbi:B1 protein-like [Euwallacea fornicatus]|uniref:B1 protein-like n=1 Tax=Euwallacea fornicatus TaxID=995702 RepID=UPI00338D375A
MLKLILASVLLVSLTQVNTLSDKQKELLIQKHNECANKSRIDQTILQRSRTGQFPNNDKLKDHILCIAKKTDFQTESGVLQRQVILAKVKTALMGDDARARNVVRECATSNPDPKLQAFNCFKCIYEKALINLL